MEKNRMEKSKKTYLHKCKIRPLTHVPVRNRPEPVRPEGVFSVDVNHFSPGKPVFSFK